MVKYICKINKYLNNNTAASDNLPRLSFLVNLAQAGPLSQLLIVVNLHRQNSVLCSNQ